MYTVYRYIGRISRTASNK